MPVNGLIAAWDKLEIKCGVSGATSASGGYSASTLCYYTPDALTMSLGIGLSVSSTRTAGGSWAASLTGSAGTYSTVGAGFGSHEISIVINDFRMYATLYAVFRQTCSSVDIYVDGVLATSVAGFDVTSAALGPSWAAPFSGMVYIDQTPTPSGVDISYTVYGGWRYQELGSGVWTSLPVTLPPASSEPPTSGISLVPPFGTITAPVGLHLPGSLLTTSTWGDHVYSTYTTTASGWDATGGKIWLVPDLSKSLQRMQTGYKADLYRFAAPEVKCSAGRAFTNTGGFATTGSSATVVSGYATVGQEVGDSASVVESPYSTPSYAMCTVGANADPVSGKHESLSYTYPNSLTFASGGDWPAMRHALIEPMYFNSAAVHPHWHTFYTPGGWDVDGSPESWAAYWGPLRQQHLITSNARNHIVASPLEYSGFTSWLDTYVGTGFRWAGVSRWQTKEVTPLTDYTYDSGSTALWSSDQGTISLDAGGVTVTP